MTVIKESSVIFKVVSTLIESKDWVRNNSSQQKQQMYLARMAYVRRKEQKKISYLELTKILKSYETFKGISTFHIWAFTRLIEAPFFYSQSGVLGYNPELLLKWGFRNLDHVEEAINIVKKELEIK